MQSENAPSYLFTVILPGLLLMLATFTMTRPAPSQSILAVQITPAIVNSPADDSPGPIIIGHMQIATPTATFTPSPTPTPTPTAAPQIRISDSPIGNPWRYLWDQPSGRLFQGPNTTGLRVVFFNLSGQQGRIHRGANATGEILFTVNFGTGRIWAGPNPTGPLLYTLVSIPASRGSLARVHEGSEKGSILYTISGDDMYEGPNETGPRVYHGSEPFRGPVQFLLPLLADHRLP